MAKLTTKARKKLPASDFAIPSKRAYPMPDKAHAANAKARVAQFGTPEEKAMVNAKANKILGKGKKKGKKAKPRTMDEHASRIMGIMDRG